MEVGASSVDAGRLRGAHGQGLLRSRVIKEATSAFTARQLGRKTSTPEKQPEPVA